MIALVTNDSVISVDQAQESSKVFSTKGLTSKYGQDSNKGMTRLAVDFTPGPYHVICNRGKRAREHNQTFREKIKESVDAYARAESKLYKSLVVSSVVEFFRKASPNGGFVKECGGIWYSCSELLAREKVGQALRDKLHSQYKSSSKAKRRRWKQEDQEKNQREGLFDNIVQSNHSIIGKMEELIDARNELGDDASDEALLALFTQHNNSILTSICTDMKLQEIVKDIWSDSEP